MDLTTTTKLEEIAIKIDAHGKAAIENILTVGKLLCEAREMLSADKEFGDWRESRISWLSQKMAYNWMNVYKNNGEMLVGNNFRPTVLYQLTAPDVPESAREAALQEESLTVKQAKELAAAHKRIEELESKKQPDTNNLIPELLKKYKGSSITPGMAHRLSVLDEEQQQIFLEHLESKQWTEKENQKLADEKLKALEELSKAIRDRDNLKQQIDELSKTDSATVLLEKEKALQEARDEYDRKVLQVRKEAEKEASELHEKRFKDQIESAEDAKKKAEKKAKEEHDRAKAAWKEYQRQENEIKKLKEQLEVDNPSNVDNARMAHVEDSGHGFLLSIYHVGKDMDRVGGGMEKSIEAAKEIINKASLEVAKLEEMQDAIITIE